MTHAMDKKYRRARSEGKGRGACVQQWHPSGKDLAALEKHAQEAYEARRKSGEGVGSWTRIV